MTERDMLSRSPRQPRAARLPLFGLFLCLLASVLLLGAAAAPQAPAARAAKAKHKAKKKHCPRRTATAVEEVFFRPGGKRRSCRAPRTDAAKTSPVAGPEGSAEESKAVKGQEGEHGTGKPAEAPHPKTEEQPAPEPTSEPAPEPTPEPTPEPEPPAVSTGFRFFSPTSFWNAPLASNAPLDPSSAPMMQAFVGEVDAEIAAERGPSINTAKWSVPLYVVPAGQPTGKVTLSGGGYPALQAAWEKVPLPANVQAAAGTDKHLVIYQPSSDKLWEFWHFEGEPGSYRAGWGGAMERVSSSSGVYSSEAWSGATSGWGGSATSISLAGGLVTLEDLERGKIDHALALAIPNVRGDFFSLPARRGDGFSTDPLALPEGARLRLDPNLDLSSLHLPWFTRLLAEAAQRYGIVVRSKAAVIDFYGQDPTPTGTNPYGGPAGYFGGMNRLDLMAAFPWQSLQLLEMQPLPTSKGPAAGHSSATIAAV